MILFTIIVTIKNNFNCDLMPFMGESGNLATCISIPFLLWILGAIIIIPIGSIIGLLLHIITKNNKIKSKIQK